MALCLTLWFRRRWPVQLALIAAAVSTFSDAAGAATLILILTVAIYRPLRTTLLVFAVNAVGLAIYLEVRNKPDDPAAVAVAAIAIYIALAGWGLYIRSRRQLLQTLRDRADRAESVARLQAEQAQLRAREEIAREMHDVLGHRLSLLSVHAGRAGVPAGCVHRGGRRGCRDHPGQRAPGIAGSARGDRRTAGTSR